ncbi:MAG: glycosyltransferase family 4 protein [Candidatus Nanopelagicales bacterium]
MEARYLFVNENIAGHRTVHVNLAKVFATRPDVQVDFLDVPPATGLRRVAAARIPHLDRQDADFQPFRAQLLAADWVRRRVRRMASRYDALHFYSHNSALLASRIMDAVPSVVSSDSTNVLNATRIPGRVPATMTPIAAAAGRAVEFPVYRHARRVIPSSQWVARCLVHVYHVDPQRIVVNPMGIPVPPLPEPAPRPPGARLRIGFVGSPFTRKGGGLLLQEYQRRWRERADLLVVTTSPVERREGLQVVNDLTPGDDRLWDILQSCDVFAFPSRIDQAPNALLEAMAAWLPVVAFDAGAVGEMIDQGRAGYLVPDGDERTFSNAVERLLEDADERQRMGRAARYRVEAAYDMRRTGDRLLDILAEAAWERAEGPR